jgi:hypothetical protein
VLGDWQAGRSDLDLLVVTDRPLDGDVLDSLAAPHAAAPERPHLDAIYLTGDLLGKPIDAPGCPHAVARLPCG